MNKKLIERVNNFTKERDWDQFHSGENLAKAISIEAAELLECYQWKHEVENSEGIKDELADVLIYCIMFADKYNLDIDKVIEEKMDKNEKKYPIEKSKGSSKKYNEL